MCRVSKPAAVLDRRLPSISRYLQSGDFHGGRLIRQRLELGAGGTVLLHQSAEGFLPPTTEKESISEVAGHEDNSPARAAKKKPVRKRRNAYSSGMHLPRSSVPLAVDSLLENPDAHVCRLSMQENEGAPVDLLLEALRDDTICNLDSIAASNFEHMWASSSLPTSTRNVTLRSDSCKNLLMPLYDLGCLG